MLHHVYFSIGSNIGNRKQLVREAIALLNERVGEVERQSSLMETAPWGFDTPNRFINACVCCLTTQTPRQLLAVTQRIELEMGRTQKTVDGKYHDRVIDIDILLYDEVCVNEPDLVIPHPHMWEREFVMMPLREIFDVDKWLLNRT